MTGDTDPEVRTVTLDRRRVLLGTGALTVGGLAGCLGGDGGDESCSDITVEAPDGTTHCVEPVESDRSVQEYYGYARGPSDSAGTPDELEANDATVTFVYRNSDNGQQSLVSINGNARTTSDGGGNVAMAFEGVSGYRWQVKDGRPGSDTGDVDPYRTPDGEFSASESVIWGWLDERTDGGAFAPLGDSFDITATSLAEGSVGDTTQARVGLGRWLLVDGSDINSYVELATIGEDAGDLSVQVRAGGD
jgi:hypothetical protein